MRRIGKILAVASLVLAVPGSGLGQERGRVVAEGRAGVAFPLGELSNLTDAGPAFGAGVAYFFHPNIGLGADLGVSLLSSSEPDEFEVIRTSEMDLIHFGAALMFEASPVSHQDTPLSFRATVAPGFTSMRAGSSEVDFSETYFTLSGLGRIGYAIRDDLELFVGTDIRMVVTDDAEMAAGFVQGPTPVEPMDLALSLPVTIGVKAKLR